MPHLLALVADINDIATFEQIASESHFAFKSGVEYAHIKEWLTLLQCDLLCIPSGLEIRKQEELATLLWEKTPTARFVVYNFGTVAPGESSKIKLFGAELALGKDGSALVKEIAAGIAKVYKRTRDPFGIVVIDDLDAARDIICSYVERLGFSDVRGVSGAQEAFSLINADRARVSCIITDVRMPEVTGAQFIKQLRSDTSLAHLPVIVLTAHGDADTLISCLREGASGFLVKPPKRGDLVRELSRAKRTILYHKDPRLARPDEIEQLKDTLEEMMANG